MTTSIPLASAVSASSAVRRWSDAEFAVDSRRVVHRFVARPVFGEDEWDLSCLSSRPNKSPFKLIFSVIPAKWRRLAKEVMAQRLNEPVASLRKTKRPKALQPESAHKLLQQMRVVFAFMDRRGITAIADLQPDDLAAFFAEIKNLPQSSRHKAGLLKVFDVFYESRDFLTGGGLAFHPFPGISLLNIAGVEAQEENLTERIPEGVMAHLLFWALAYVDTFSSDILAAEALKLKGPEPGQLARAEARAEALAEANARKGPQRSSKVTVALRWQARLEVYLEMRGEPLGIPARVKKGKIVPAADRVAREAGLPLSYLTGPGTGLVRLRQSNLPLRLECFGALKVRLSGAKAPWREPLTFLELNRECRRLQVAAYIVIAYLSGMRDSEVQTLSRGCISERTDERGEIYRYKLSGRTFKGQHGRSKERQWVVIEPVARAVRVLEALTATLHDKNLESYLFASLRHSDNSMGLFRSTINQALCDFAERCETTIAPRQSGADIPASVKHDGQPWRFKVSQFRRTLAWHIANQPFGVVAGMIQYGHASIQMFEGYAGTSESGFAAEVAKDSFLARLEDVVQMFEDEERGIRPAGPMATELSAFFERKRTELGTFPGEIADAKRVRELLKQKAADLHVGPLVHCFYTPAQAKCRPNLEAAEQAGPLVGLCDPDCSNACWAHKSLASWERLFSECSSMLKVNSIPHRQREILKRQRDTTQRVVNAIKAASQNSEHSHG